MKVAIYLRVGNKEPLIDADTIRKENTEMDKQAIGFAYDSIGVKNIWKNRRGR